MRIRVPGPSPLQHYYFSFRLESFRFLLLFFFIFICQLCVAYLMPLPSPSPSRFIPDTCMLCALEENRIDFPVHRRTVAATTLICIILLLRLSKVVLLGWHQHPTARPRRTKKLWKRENKVRFRKLQLSRQKWSHSISSLRLRSRALPFATRCGLRKMSCWWFSSAHFYFLRFHLIAVWFLFFSLFGRSNS